MLPHNLEAERSILGAVLIDGNAMAVAASVVTPAMFFRQAHKDIFECLCEMAARQEPLDLVLLNENLRVKKVDGSQQNMLEEVGGPAYLASLLDGVPRSTNVEHYAKVVREKAWLRAVIFSTSKTLTHAYEEQEPAARIVGAATDALIGCIQGAEGSLVPATKAMSDYVAGLDTASAPISTGYSDLDVVLRGGYHPGDLIIVAARPSVGKTSFVLGSARHLAAQGRKALFASIEMSRNAIAARLLSWESGVPSQRLEMRTADSEDYQRVMAALEGPVSGLMIEDTARTLMEVASWCRLARPECLIVDYIQLMVPEVVKGPRDDQGEVAAISRGLKRLAKELGIPVVALSQLSRAPETSKDKRPQLSHLRSSGALEQDADVVVLLFREEMHTQRDDNRGVAEAIVAKQRNGPTGVTRLAFVSELAQFRNLAPGF